MEIMEPIKAATIMAADPMEIPLLRKKIISIATTSLAPEEIPSTNGPAIGLLKKVCRRNPDTDRAPPRMMTARILGRRISHIIL